MSTLYRRSRAALALIALMTTACGTSPTDFNSCTGETGTCTEVPKSSTSDAVISESACSGVFAIVACSTENSVGNCVASSGETSLSIVYYSPFYIEADAREQCENFGGSWGGSISTSGTTSSVTVTNNTLFEPINLDEKSRP